MPLKSSDRPPAVVVDGKPLCHVDGAKWCEFERLEIAMRQIQQILAPSGGELRVYVDASLRHQLASKDRNRLEQAILDGTVLQTPARVPADAFILKWAHEHGALVVSPDKFLEYEDQYPWLSERGRTFGPLFEGSHWTFFERFSGRGNVPKTLEEVIEGRSKRRSVRGQPRGGRTSASTDTKRVEKGPHAPAPNTRGVVKPRSENRRDESVANGARVTDLPSDRDAAEVASAAQAESRAAPIRRANEPGKKTVAAFAHDRGLLVSSVLPILGGLWPSQTWSEESILTEEVRHRVVQALKSSLDGSRSVETLGSFASSRGTHFGEVQRVAQSLWPSRICTATTYLYGDDARVLSEMLDGLDRAKRRSSETIATFALQRKVPVSDVISVARSLWPRRVVRATSTLADSESRQLATTWTDWGLAAEGPTTVASFAKARGLPLNEVMEVARQMRTDLMASDSLTPEIVRLLDRKHGREVGKQPRRVLRSLVTLSAFAHDRGLLLQDVLPAARRLWPSRSWSSDSALSPEDQRVLSTELDENRVPKEGGRGPQRPWWSRGRRQSRRDQKTEG